MGRQKKSIKSKPENKTQNQMFFNTKYVAKQQKSENITEKQQKIYSNNNNIKQKQENIETIGFEKRTEKQEIKANQMQIQI